MEQPADQGLSVLPVRAVRFAPESCEGLNHNIFISRDIDAAVSVQRPNVVDNVLLENEIP